MNTLQLQKFEGVAKFLKVLFKILFILCLVGGGLALIFAATCLFIPSSVINELIGMLNTLDTSLKMGEFSVYMSNLNITVAGIKTIGISIFLIVAVAAAIGAYLFIQLEKILGNVVNKTPFAQGSIVAMKHLSIAIIAYSLFTSMGSFITSQLMLENFLNRAIDISANLVERVDFDLDLAFILAGLLVYLLAKIFEYGASLQSEVDEML